MVRGAKCLCNQRANRTFKTSTSFYNGMFLHQLRKVEFPNPLRHLSSLIRSLAAAMIPPNHQQLILQLLSMVKNSGSPLCYAHEDSCTIRVSLGKVFC